MKCLGVEARISEEQSAVGSNGSEGLNGAAERVRLALVVLPEAAVVNQTIPRNAGNRAHFVLQQSEDWQR